MSDDLHPSTNPLLQRWTTPFEAPPFGSIRPEHFPPAFEAALAADRAEIAAIAADPAPPTFENVIAALERAGRDLDRVAAVFFNLTGADTNETLRAIERDVSPVLARHADATYLNDDLFRRVDDLVRREAELGLDPERSRVLRRYHRLFTRRGAGLPAETRERLAAIGERLALLGVRFGQNLLADEQAFVLPLGADDLDGLPPFVLDATRSAASERGLDGHVVTLSRSVIEPFLQYATRRDLREAAWKAWTSRGETGGPTDNRAIVAETVALRAEKARLLGFPSFAHFRLDDGMAKTPQAVEELLGAVWTRAKALAAREEADLQRLADRDGVRIAPWDWRFYAERVRRDRFDLDAAAVKPYLPLPAVTEAAFDCAARLFGLAFTERFDLPAYHPDVRAYEVTRAADGAPVGLFLTDALARTSKRSGAWMSSFRGQRKLDGDVRPIVVNVMSFAGAAGDGPCLLSFDDARTLFHEFGHALHGLLSDVTFPAIAGTSVPRDFVEFPSQLYEHWLERPEVLARFARHHRTGEPMPAELIQRLERSRSFNQGCATVEYVSSALVDLAFHQLADAPADLDVMAFERSVLERLGMPDAIVMRHRTPHFGHVFAGDGYSSAYYSYMWSEVLDADGFGAFEEAGDPFDPETARRLRDYVYAAGDLREPDEAYRLFRGRAPDPSALMRRRGLMPAGLPAAA